MTRRAPAKRAMLLRAQNITQASLCLQSVEGVTLVKQWLQAGVFAIHKVSGCSAALGSEVKGCGWWIPKSIAGFHDQLLMGSASLASALEMPEAPRTWQQYFTRHSRPSALRRLPASLPHCCNARRGLT